MPTWDLREKYIGCRLNLTALQRLEGIATRTLNNPQVSWQARGKDFEFDESSLTSIAASQHADEILELTLQVTEPTTETQVIVKLGDRYSRTKHFFAVAYATWETSWYSHVHIRHPSRSAGEDLGKELKKELQRAQILRSYTSLMLLAQWGWQSLCLWTLVSLLIEQGSFRGMTDQIAYIGAGLALLFVPHSAVHLALRSRVKLSTPVGWWARLVASPNTGTALGAVFGILSFVLAAILAVREFWN
ncbi:hypothetical protein ACFVY0_06120 [Streptomyces sp. NPDC058286]|uniref:hypothetical protein n=2 Tax=unclassified Streptomyces TaxID=2593676 RepID=UPI0036E3DAAE